MKCGIRKLAILALAGALTFGSAFAQDQDTDGLIETYNNAVENLDAVLNAGAERGAEAFELLSFSSNQLLALSLDSASESLTTALEQVLDRARIAVQNQSQTDLVVQTAVLRGGFQRIVYDSALGAATQGNLELAKTRLAQLITDLNLSEATAAAVRSGETVDALRLAMEAGIADVVAQRLGVTSNLIEVDPAQAYEALAITYGTFLLVQDSPRAQTDMNQRFVAAANALVNDETETVGADLGGLSDDFVVLGNAALAGQPTVDQRPSIEGTPDVPDPGTDVPEPAVLPTTDPVETTPVETTPVETTPVETTPVETTPVETTPAATDPSSEGTPTELTLEELEALLAEQQRAEAIELLRSEVAGYGVAAGTAEAFATRLHDDGFSSVDDVFTALYATTARAAVAIEVGEEAKAKGLIGDFAASYRSHLAPIIEVANPTLNSQADQLTANLLDGLALRLQDVVGLVGHISAMSDDLAGLDVLSTHQAIVTTSLFWNGLVRLIFVILFGLLAFVPLYLLNLAFGGGNRNWQLVGVALFLLLLPIIYEALAFVGNVVADLSGNDIFNFVANYSIFQNTISQMVWAFVTAIAILFAIIGLYGICVQFGLLGRKRPTIVGNDTTEVSVRASTTEPADSLVDWDEEF